MGIAQSVHEMLFVRGNPALTSVGASDYPHGTAAIAIFAVTNLSFLYLQFLLQRSNNGIILKAIYPLYFIWISRV